MGNKYIYILALAAYGQGISGSDRIFIEFARRWSKSFPVTIYVWEEGYQMCQRQNLTKISNIKYQISNMQIWKKLGFVVNYFARIVEGIRIGLTLKIEDPNDTIIYSASEFWMDSLPALFLKLRYPNIRWVACWFQTAPKPWIGYTEGDRKEKYNLTAFLYWLVQFPIKPMITQFTDYVLVNNEIEKQQFPRLLKHERVIVVLGAVDLKKIENWKLETGNIPKVYDAVFQGRLHPQKGVLELIDIWKLVIMQKSNAKLVMIGDGPLMKNVRLKIKKEGLENNIFLKGYLFDGEEKYRIFSQSRVVVHPSFFDSGGMAAAEAMAFGLPCVGFDLNSYRFYYPEGMLKVPLADLETFSEKILELLSNKNLYSAISKQANRLINTNWSWDFRARQILKQVLE